MSDTSAAAKATPAESQESQGSVLSPDIEQIINSGAKQAGPTGSRKAIFAASLLTAVALWFSFAPFELAPLAWIALVPLTLLVRIPELPRRSFGVIYFAGLIWGVATIQWMRLGHPAMYGAVTAMGIYLGFYFPAFVAISRRVHKAGLPIWLTCGLVWTSLEFLRAYLFTGFAWYFLGHSQYQFTPLVQISDLTGAYGVSFILACFSGCLAGQISVSRLSRWGLVPEESCHAVRVDRRMPAVTVCLFLVAVSCGYGLYRIQPDAAAKPGPVVALAQGNFTPELKHDPDKWGRMVNDHDMLSRQSSFHKPDLIVWPETMFPVPDRIVEDELDDADLTAFLPPEERGMNKDWAQIEIDSWREQRARKMMTNRSLEYGTAMLIGLLTEVAGDDGRQRYNSAAYFRPDLGYVGRYDKNHRVIFGEYIPLRSVFPWLAQVTPFGAGFGLNAGQETVAFEGNGFTFTPVICFEDTVPSLVRRAVNTHSESGRQPDVIVNITNDAWFRGSAELDQHLIAATFRCIETRRPMVRAVNAGISAFIDSSGRIRDPEHFELMSEKEDEIVPSFNSVESMIDPETGKRYRQVSAMMCAEIPLDGRSTLYLMWGDWFAWLLSICVLLCVGRSFLSEK